MITNFILKFTMSNDNSNNMTLAGVTDLKWPLLSALGPGSLADNNWCQAILNL